MPLLLGIDDTDVLGHKPGTGRLARELGAYLQESGLARLLGVVRHQLLVDPRIPYTSHNSPACAILETRHGGDAAAIFDAAAGWVVTRCADGSDPGLCLALQASLPASVTEFGWRAASRVVEKSEALQIAGRCDLLLRELGGTGDGVIGALAAVGLTADGNGGRFLELAGGLRDLPDPVRAADLRRMGIRLASTSRDGEAIAPDAMIATGDWLRPRLIAGFPVVLVERNGAGWRCFDRKQRKSEDEPE